MTFYKTLHRIPAINLVQLYKWKNNSNMNMNMNMNNRIVNYTKPKEKIKVKENKFNYKKPIINKQNSIILYKKKPSELLVLDNAIKNNKNDKYVRFGIIGLISTTSFYSICYNYIFSQNIELFCFN